MEENASNIIGFSDESTEEYDDVADFYIFVAVLMSCIKMKAYTCIFLWCYININKCEDDWGKNNQVQTLGFYDCAWGLPWRV